MAKQRGKIYLGFEEETINEKSQSLINYTVNKIGGLPNWPPLPNIQLPSKCPLCGLHRLQVVQCYAPLDNSVYHRTLYVFACINPNCWIQSESWLCVRSQFQDNSGTEANTLVAMPNTELNLTWCNGADEWDENDNGDNANGNYMNVDNAPSPNNQIQRNSDEEEESNSFELETVEQALGNLQVYDAHNANTSPVQGAVGAISAPVAAAELEGGDEPGLVTVDTPTAPTNDIESLLHETSELPGDLRSRLVCGQWQFIPKFIYVEEEWKKNVASDDKINELLNKYRIDNGWQHSHNSFDIADVHGSRLSEIEPCAIERAGAGGGAEEETYEDEAPLHGDRLFHAFLSRLRKHPGQILRYSRDEPPILGAPLPTTASTPESPSVPTVCIRCGSRLVCELQLVPEFAETLQLPSHTPLTHLHFLSILIFTCSQSCWQVTDSLVNEHVVFQPEIV